jgi:hypothetical protein
MKVPARDFVTVDMHGLKAPLVARAQADRVSVSLVVRRAVERELGCADVSRELACEGKCPSRAHSTVKLSLRLTNAEAEQLTDGARQAGLSRGAYLSGLLAGVSSLTNGSASRPDCLSALSASCAELSTLSRNLNQLASLLRQGQGRAAMEYREMLDTLGADVRGHLAMAASQLAELRPARPPRVPWRQRPGGTV